MSVTALQIAKLSGVMYGYAQMDGTLGLRRRRKIIGEKAEFKGDLLKEIGEIIEKGKERRSRIVQELFKLYDRVRELEGELEEEITELLKRIDEDDYIIHFVGTTLEEDGLEWWTKKGKEIRVRADGSIEVCDRRGKPILRV